MKERPILFSAPMVRAILAGTKTQTRRIVKPRGRPDFVVLGQSEDPEVADWWPYQSDDGESELCDDGCEHPYFSPYGMAGDRLWVRETWSTHACFDHLQPKDCPKSIHYWADGKTQTGKGRPSIHMPRWASRIDLAVTGVRVERLQDISEADAIAEGQQHGGNDSHAPWGFEGVPASFCDCPVTAYAALWEQINGAGSWDANPWVWVVEFRRIKP